MRSLQRFEDWVAETLEGRLGGLLGGRVQPADLARRVGEAMDDARTVGPSAVFTANRFEVHLAPATLDRFAGFRGALETELANFVAERGVESGYRFVGRPTVTLLADPRLRADQVRVEAELLDQGPAAPQVTRELSLGAIAPSAPRELALAAPGRGAVPLAGETLALGRSLDNDIVVPDASVSRHHARLMRRGAYWLLEDLSSTHGSFVNGQRVTSSLLRGGDEVRLGSAVLKVVLADDGRPGDP